MSLPARSITFETELWEVRYGDNVLFLDDEDYAYYKYDLLLFAGMRPTISFQRSASTLPINPKGLVTV